LLRTSQTGQNTSTHVSATCAGKRVMRDLRFSQFTMFNQHDMLEDFNLLCM